MFGLPFIHCFNVILRMQTAKDIDVNKKRYLDAIREAIHTTASFREAGFHEKVKRNTL